MVPCQQKGVRDGEIHNVNMCSNSFKIVLKIKFFCLLVSNDLLSVGCSVKGQEHISYNQLLYSGEYPFRWC